jgi:hypothetical protein
MATTARLRMLVSSFDRFHLIAFPRSALGEPVRSDFTCSITRSSFDCRLWDGKARDLISIYPRVA